LRRFELTALDTAQVRLTRAVDMRFGMQVHELDVDVPLGASTLSGMEQVTRDFITKYEATYGRDSAYLAAGIEYVTFRVIGTYDMERPVLEAAGVKDKASASLTAQRKAYFAPDGHIDTEFHAGWRLVPGQVLNGPAVVQRSGDTVVLPPQTRAEVDRYGGLTITWQGGTR
jgi:N-methylhydantoinase A